MVLKFYGFTHSSNARRAFVVIKELGLDYQVINVDITKQEQFDPGYTAFQPFAKVPCIDDDGFKLYESRAIARYLAAKAKSPLLPTEIKAVALFEQAASIENNFFDPPAVQIMLEKFVKPTFLNLETNEEVVKENLALLKGVLDVYEQILSKSKYLAGDELTLADLFHLPVGTVLTLIGVNLLVDPSKPNVARWWKDISTRPSWLEMVNSA